MEDTSAVSMACPCTTTATRMFAQVQKPRPRSYYWSWSRQLLYLLHRLRQHFLRHSHDCVVHLPRDHSSNNNACTTVDITLKRILNTSRCHCRRRCGRHRWLSNTCAHRLAYCAPETTEHGSELLPCGTEDGRERQRRRLHCTSARRYIKDI
ncbi:hypothetical protein BU25DRAFT_50101 [Macroventuria anomochaeta]|uniref:Uncharacterized protein n=1 Tax=Macroventuria anomochaeta TaxID=301207 RepID=A0ACB6RZV9_9PLEO|nr:uncharacterized protein BU25DRAFT_50101 [Macroventuria anomochaeta]KAF2627561.1 hypothetical protein BU25DRAFT_50101 [Macroventuria anomochaeta]